MEKHNGACARGAGIFQPARLIDVGPVDGSKAPHLWIASDQQPDLQNILSRPTVTYAALSYCWGNKLFSTLTSSTTKALKSSIPMDSLPRTIQDAIRIVRRLGIRYLWIDCLCILQGSDKEAQDDWARESGRMDQIYREAILTIAAASASNAHNGIFHQRSKAKPRCLLEYPSVGKSGVSGTVAIGPSHEKYPEKSEPLHRRAWALQERILSTRILEYGTTEMSWICHCAEFTESGGVTDTSESLKNVGSMVAEYVSPLHEEAQLLSLRWISIVEDYSGREMTRVSDKLQALAGLAKVIYENSADRYLAGVWQARLPEQLLWKHLGKIVNGRREYPKPSSDRMPSWAWTSMNGKVEFCKYKSASFQTAGKLVRPRLRIISCKVESSLPGGFGDISGGKLVIEGPVKKIPTMRCESIGRYYGVYENYAPWRDLQDGLKTHLDNVDELPEKLRKTIPGAPNELFNTRFLFIERDLSAGLILLKEKHWFRNRTVFKRIGLFEGYRSEERDFKKGGIRSRILRII